MYFNGLREIERSLISDIKPIFNLFKNREGGGEIGE